MTLAKHELVRYFGICKFHVALMLARIRAPSNAVRMEVAIPNPLA